MQPKIALLGEPMGRRQLIVLCWALLRAAHAADSCWVTWSASRLCLCVCMSLSKWFDACGPAERVFFSLDYPKFSLFPSTRSFLGQTHSQLNIHLHKLLCMLYVTLKILFLDLQTCNSCILIVLSSCFYVDLCSRQTSVLVDDRLISQEKLSIPNYQNEHEYTCIVDLEHLFRTLVSTHWM